MDKFNYLKEQLAAALATWQQTNGGKTTVGWMHAANPEVVSELLAELEEKDKRIIGLERHVKDIEATLIAATDEVADLTKERDEARAKLATPVRLPALPGYRHNDRQEVRAEKDGFISGVEESASALRKQGFTVEGNV